MKFKNAIYAFSLLLFCAVSTSCQKDHDLVSSYVIKPSQSVSTEKSEKQSVLVSTGKIPDEYSHEEPIIISN